MSNRCRRFHAALLASLLLLGGSAVARAEDFLQLMSVQFINDTGGTVKVEYVELYHGAWDKKAVSGDTIPEGGTYSFSSGIIHHWQSTAGDITLRTADGTKFFINWYWLLASTRPQIDVQASAGPDTSEYRMEMPDPLSATFVVTLKAPSQ